jgi:uridine kinase
MRIFTRLLTRVLDQQCWSHSDLAQRLELSVPQLGEILDGRPLRLLKEWTTTLQRILDLSIEAANYSVESRPQEPHTRPIIIGISGASCSGKSWLAETLHQQHFTESQIIDLDGYYRDLQSVQLLEHGHDNPASIDFDQAIRDLAQLKSGHSVRLPNYSYETHQVDGFRHSHPTPIILIEGLFIFAHPQLRDAIDIKIWMETREELRLERRIVRDTACRERTIEEIQERYQRDVAPGYRKFIQPLSAHADIIVTNNGQDFLLE